MFNNLYVGGVFVAHLIKLEDYVSRYQSDMYRYPSQFSRLKRERWTRLKQVWERSYLNEEPTVEQFVDQQKKTVRSAFDKLKKLYKKEDQTESFLENFEQPNYQFKYKTLAELKTHFMHELFHFQLNWASSTLLEKSTFKKAFLYDETLKWLLYSFPDNYFVLYYPIVIYPKATVQFDILVIGPTEIWCIVQLDGKENSIFQTFSERYWIELYGDNEKKVINPFLSLNRMSTIIKRILAETELELSVRKAVLTKEGYIDVNAPWSGAVFLDQRSIDEWQKRLVNNSTPIKSIQLKFSQALLNVCQTTSEPRTELGYKDDEGDSSFEVIE